MSTATQRFAKLVARAEDLGQTMALFVGTDMPATQTVIGSRSDLDVQLDVAEAYLTGIEIERHRNRLARQSSLAAALDAARIAAEAAKPKTVHVSVTQEDIDKGVRRSSSSCPNYLAVARALGRSDIHVGVFFVCDTTYDRITDMPAVAGDWIRRFDAQMPVEPIEYDLTLKA